MTSFRPALNSTAIVSSVLAPCLYSSSPGLPQGIRPRAAVCLLSLSAVWPAPKETGKAIRLPHHHRVSAFPRSAPSRLGRRGGSRLLALGIAARRAVRAAVFMHELRAAVGADADELHPRRMVTVAGGFAVRGARDADLRDWFRPASDACVGSEL